ncbi:anthranilate phosphoribosyltransferase [Micrococcales bacterium 31B]|nr:anthranilate phosphoribosyltransferase [Micrococcales bacterium 31B]
MAMDTWSTVLTSLQRRESLRPSSAKWAMQQIMRNEATPAQMGAFLMGLQAKGATSDEVIGLRNAALEAAMPVAIGPDAVDIVGTGGDPWGVMNISSVAILVAAAAGVPVIKHGNKGASSASGASDLLTELGVNIAAPAERVAEVFAEVGIAYLHAAAYHPSFRFVAPVRGELGVPTVFNMLGPLCNPARPNATCMGVAAGQPIDVIAGVFQQRGATAFVVQDEFGIDKLTNLGSNSLHEVSRGQIHVHEIDAVDLGMPRGEMADVLGGTPAENAVVARAILAGEEHPARHAIVLNAGAALAAYRLSLDVTLVEQPILERLGVACEDARAALSSGGAADVLARWSAALPA